ncbi:conserved hypothetical protein [Alphaproteobacteria bacterium]
MTISIEEDRRISDKYSEFTCLLLYLHADSYPDYGSDQKVIEHYVELFCKEALESTIKQGREVLELQPFPCEWVSTTCNRFPFEKFENATTEGYYNWVKWLLEVLEAEARKAGKL